MLCARCGRGVYYAERKLGFGKVWHSFCFSCYKCRKLLDACSANCFCGELFCNACYRCICDNEDRAQYICCDSQEPFPCCVNISTCGSSKGYTAPPNCPPSNNSSQQSCCKMPCMDPQASSNEPCPRQTCCKPKGCPDPCDPCCSPLPCKPCCDPCCACCRKVDWCCPETENFCLRKTCPPKKCVPQKICDDCCPKFQPPPKSSTNCDPCGPDCCPPECCPDGCTLIKVVDPKDPDGCPPCCPPYCPPPRKPICYPPTNCCENDPCAVPTERICYFPQPANKYCSCGDLNPCDCCLKNCQKPCEICCRRCGRKVYAAEKILISGGAFHSCCFSCYCCHKSLEITNYYENQGEIYCKTCYSRFFGLQGYGYGSVLRSVE